MKKIGILAFLLAAVMVFAGCGKSDKIGKIDVAAAQEIALKALGIDGTEIHAASVVLCERDGVSYYDVEITVDGTAYSFAVDAVTGVIIEQSGVAETAAPQETLPGTAGVCIGKDAAYETLLKAAGFTPAHAQMTDCELKQVDGCWQYEITFIGVDQTYFGKVDATSGEYLSCTLLTEASKERGGEYVNMQAIPPQIGSDMIIDLIPAEVDYPPLALTKAEFVSGIFKDTTLLNKIMAHSGYSRKEIQVHARLFCRAGSEKAFYVYFSTPDGKFFRYVVSIADFEILDWESAESLDQLKHPLRNSDTEVILPENSISIEEAYGYALKVYQRYDFETQEVQTVWADDVILYVAQPDYDNGEYQYDFIFQEKKTGWFFTVTVRARDGAILYIEYGQWRKGYFGGFEDVAAVKVSEYEAKRLALSYVPGAALTNVTKFDVDTADGKLEYVGTITYLGMKYEFHIDAYSGAFRTWSTQPIG